MPSHPIPITTTAFPQSSPFQHSFKKYKQTSTSTSSISFAMSQVYDTVDISSLRLAPPRASKASAACKTAYIQDGNGDRLSIQTPVMRLPWDIVPKQMDESANVTASLSLSFSGDDEDVQKFKEFLMKFDEKIKELAQAISGTLGKKSETKVIDANFKDSVKEATTGDYPPTFQPKVWLTCREGGNTKCVDDFTMDLTVYNMDGKKITQDELRKGCPAAAVIQPSYVWCSSMGVGITWVAKQCVVKPSIKEEFAFKLDSRFDKYRDEPSPKKARVDQGSTTEENDDDNDDDNDQSSSMGDPLENEEF